VPPNRPTRQQPPAVFWLLFGLVGRISRRIYWLCYLLVVCLQSVILSQIIGGAEASFHDLAASFGPAVLIATLYLTFAISVKRLHDVGYGGFLALALLIPFVNIAFSIWIGLLPGMAGPNRFGEAPDVPPT
jgi:uncharacterized membrane protein YhaH (DUF805 family)